MQTLAIRFSSSLGKYKSCTNIENCEECISEQECTKYQNSYELNKECKICEKDSKTATLSKVAIVLSSIAIVLFIAVILLLLLLYKKFFKKQKNNEIIKIPEENNEENGVNEVVVHSKKRSIHNTAIQSNNFIKKEN